MKVLVLGATGQTGFQVVNQFLENNFQVKAIVRSADKFLELQDDVNLELFLDNIWNMEDEKLKGILTDVGCVVSCLGHNISLKGLFGKPHYLVTESIKKVYSNLAGKETFKFILMNTTACLNRMENETFTFGESLVMGILRTLLPPQRDNEGALKYLQETIGTESTLEWIAVRPDTLIDHDQVSKYELFDTPQRSPIFNAGQTSRINVAHFIVSLAAETELWRQWRFKTPVIYNSEN